VLVLVLVLVLHRLTCWSISRITTTLDIRVHPSVTQFKSDIRLIV
jgi:hypothetical protein